MLMELIVFAVVLVTLQMIGGFIAFKIVMSKKFLKNYMQMVTEVTNEVTKDMIGNFNDQN